MAARVQRLGMLTAACFRSWICIMDSRFRVYRVYRVYRAYRAYRDYRVDRV